MVNIDINIVWQKAIVDGSPNPDLIRKDYAGAWIRKEDYGKQTDFGWQVDHLRPVSKGGTDDLDNLFPLHWRNNLSKSSDYPRWTTEMSSDGAVNVEQSKYWKTNE